MEGETMDGAPQDGSSFDAYDPDHGWVECHWYSHHSVSGWVSNDIDCGWYEFNPIKWRKSVGQSENEVTER